MLQDDLILIDKARSNKEDFGLIYAKYRGAVFAYLLKRVDHNKEIADDLAEETFFHALENLSHFAPTGKSYLSYLLTIAHNILLNYYRTKKPVALDECESIITSGSEEEALERAEIHQEAEAVISAIHKLNHAGEQLLSLRYENGLSIKGIAKIIHKTPNAVKLALSRYRKKLIDDPSIVSIAKEFKNKHVKRFKQLVFWDR